jgi:mono/diheme cytochrome c family protein
MKSGLGLFLGVLAGSAAAPAFSADKLEYNRTIRPILAENCFACHGPDSAARKADLRLDKRDEATKTDAIVPGDLEASEMIRRILSDDPKEVMPPPMTKKTLTKVQKELLQRWVKEGAEYQQHWSLITTERPQPPHVKNAAWVRTPIDNFILAKLEELGLAPAPEADRRTLARRLSLDLTGLPPDPAEVEAFVNDNSPDAWGRLVDHILDKPEWGEHRGRYWLDAARYADTHGIHFDNFREIWSYREWVIKAFNRNMPFDQFTIEQLAGDLLPNRTLDQVVASGFNRCNITTNEGGAIDEEYKVLYTRDRIETTSQVWMGLTAGCAVCHDHKFDPLTTKEFYSMSAFFNNTTQAAMDGNIKDTPPTLFVPRNEDREKWESLTRMMADVRGQIDARKTTGKGEFEAWLAQITPTSAAELIPVEGLTLSAPLNEGDGRAVHVTVGDAARELSIPTGFNWAEGRNNAKVFSLEPGDTLEVPEAGDFEGDQPFSCSAWLRLPKDNLVGSVVARMKNTNGYRGWDIWVEGNRVGTHIINNWSDNALKVVARTPLKSNEWYHVAITYDGSKKAAGIKIYVNGAAQDMEVQADSLRDTTRTDVPFKIGQRNAGERLPALMLENLRIYARALAPIEAANLARADRLAQLFAKPAEQRTDAERNELFDYWQTNLDPVARELRARVGAMQQAEANIKAAGTIAHVMQEKAESPMAFILFRGEYDKRRDQVTPETPAALPPFPADSPKNRLGFAQWLLRPEHPLTARVTVNRFWQEVFGTGIVRTTGDLGVSGELPSHPELLDWLAAEFRESGWDMKRFFKMLVTSATYRQAAVATREKLEKDSQNRFLSRGPRFRMDGEVIRDCALASSGLLVRKLGGPSVKPYQPPGVWEAVAMIGSNTRDYKPDTGESLYRRSLYTFWKRSAPPALLDLFNAPSREVCSVRRERTNTPLQALATLNDPTFVEAARHLAQNALTQGGATADDRLRYVAERLLARPFSTEESQLVQATLKELLEFYTAHPEDSQKLISVGETKAGAAIDASTLAAWTMLANELMNLDEVLNK